MSYQEVSDERSLENKVSFELKSNYNDIFKKKIEN